VLDAGQLARADGMGPCDALADQPVRDVAADAYDERNRFPRGAALAHRADDAGAWDGGRVSADRVRPRNRAADSRSDVPRVRRRASRPAVDAYGAVQQRPPFDWCAVT